MTKQEILKELKLYKQATLLCLKEEKNNDYYIGYLSAISLFIDKIEGNAETHSTSKDK